MMHKKHWLESEWNMKHCYLILHHHHSSDTLAIGHVKPVEVVHTDHCGQFHKEPNLALLQAGMAPGHHISVSKLAQMIGIHRNTLHSYLKKYKIEYQHTQWWPGFADKAFSQYQATDRLHKWYLSGSPRRHGLRIQRQRIAESLHRVDPLGRVLHCHTTVHRCQYQVSRPNALWHMGEHHKLIPWGIVIYGIVDGYWCTVCAVLSEYFLWSDALHQAVALEAHINNKSSTVLETFLHGVERFGLPSRVHGDRGGENQDTDVLMIMAWGPNRASFMWRT